jgi:hypothetical protein
MFDLELRSRDETVEFCPGLLLLYPATRILQQPVRQLTSEKSYKLRSGGFFIVILCLEEEAVHHCDRVVTRAQVYSGKFVDARAAFDTRQARRI